MRKNIISIFLLLASFANAEFTQKSESIILDSKTGFLWEDTKTSKTTLRTFKEASAYCKDLELDGQKGWIIPNLKELFSIVNTQAYNPTSFPQFKFTAADTYWTTRLYSRGISNDAYTITFKTGSLYRRNMDDKFFVRCLKKSK